MGKHMKKAVSLTVDGMNPGERYWVRIEIPINKSGQAIAASEYIDTFLGISLGAGNYLYAHWQREESVDVRHIVSIILAV